MSARNKILFHITYFEQGQSLEQACRLTKELGGDGLEFRGVAFDGTASIPGYLDQISRALDKQPLEWVSFGAPGINLMHPDKSLREKELERAVQFYDEASRRFPVKLINARTGRLQNPDTSLSALAYQHHGSAIATDEQWQCAIEGYKILGKIAEQNGFRFAFETHGLFLHDTVQASLRLIEQIDHPNVGMLWDHVNLLLFPTSPTLEEVVRSAKGKIYGVHLKNVLIPPAQFLAVCDLAQGIINIREQMQLLLIAGFEGPWCIECPRAGDRQHFAEKDICYLRQLLSLQP